MKSIQEHNSQKYDKYKQLDAQSYNTNVACPDCSIELLKTNPGKALNTNPPQIQVKCPSCKQIFNILA